MGSVARRGPRTGLGGNEPSCLIYSWKPPFLAKHGNADPTQTKSERAGLLSWKSAAPLPVATAVSHCTLSTFKKDTSSELCHTPAFEKWRGLALHTALFLAKKCVAGSFNFQTFFQTSNEMAVMNLVGDCCWLRFHVFAQYYHLRFPFLQFKVRKTNSCQMMPWI